MDYDFMNSPEMKRIFNEAKWMLILGVLSDKELAESHGLGEDAARPVYEFFKVFYEHDVDPEIVVEALEKLKAVSSKKNDEVSSSDLTSFVKVLNDIQKKKGEK